MEENILKESLPVLYCKAVSFIFKLVPIDLNSFTEPIVLKCSCIPQLFLTGFKGNPKYR